MAIPFFIEKLLAYSVGLFFSVVVSLSFIWQLLTKGTKGFKLKDRRKPPECMLDATLGTHHFVHLEHVRLHYVACGAEDKPLMVLLHGFPECWYSWRYQLKAFSADYRMIAVDMRGYSESDKPSRRSSYKIEKLAMDIKQLIPALGYRSCTLVGHDWGGAVTWAVAAFYPDIVDRAIIMNCPHPIAFFEHLRTCWAQFKKSWYMFFFLIPILPEIRFRNTDLRILHVLFRGKVAGIQNPERRMSDEDLEAYKYAFSQRGATTGGLNYIRAGIVNKPPKKLHEVIKKPILMIWGENDAFLDIGSVALSAKFADNFTVRTVPGSSHWVQMDEPEVVNDYMREFLTGKKLE